MAIRTILEVPDPRLRRISEPVGEITEEIRQLIADMFDTMYDASGIGLAAAQVDVPLRLVVMDLKDGAEDADGKPTSLRRVFINPEIMEPSDDLSVYNEGCLSVPDQYADVERPATVRARWRDEHGTQHDEPIDGMLATCLQHEMDHLNGILFIDHLSRLKRGIVLKKLEKFRQDGVRKGRRAA